MLSMAEAIERLYKIGAEAERKIGEQADDQLLKAIKENPGWTPYNLAQEMGCQVGRVYASLGRLQKQGKIYVKKFSSKGKR